MNIHQKIGQLFIIGFEGTTLTPRLRSLYAALPFGGIIYFNRNIKSPGQLRSLTDNLQTLPKHTPPLLVSIDQEGGIVSRLKSPFTQFPGNNYLGKIVAKTSSTELARKQAIAMAKELRAVGVNLNFSPVVDIDTNPKNPVIGQRAFSSDPTAVSRLAEATLSGYREVHLLSCLKHYPGHGDTSEDSHMTLPVLPLSEEQVRRRELYPYKQLIPLEPDMIMTAHILFPEIDPRPVTFSPFFIKTLLRDELGFQSVVISDDMNMNAIKSTYKPEQWGVMAIEAGIDMIIISTDTKNQLAAFRGLVRAVKSGRIRSDRIDESVARVQKLTTSLTHENREPLDVIGLPAHQKIAHEIRRLGQ